jgi:hypothetical protein
MLTLPFFQELAPAKSILLAGAGGGFDVFSGLPLYFALCSAGKTVHLANLTFTNILPQTGTHIAPYLIEVSADTDAPQTYFPEVHLCRWLRTQSIDTSIFCFDRTGPKPLAESYRLLLDRLDFDTVILVDGGTDSLMRGDEAGLGTPVEDISSILAADQLPIPRKFLTCLGFGIDHFHDVCHAQVLEAIAELTRSGGYLGSFSLMREMPEVRLFIEATKYVLAHTAGRESIVCTSILSAIEGQYGNHHSTDRTMGSELYINPLMSLYWCFRLQEIADRILYRDLIKDTPGFLTALRQIENYRVAHPTRPRRPIPL